MPPDQLPPLPEALAARLERGELHMSYPKAKAELVITGLESPINEHLLKLLAVEADDAAVSHWRHELAGWLRKVARIRLKPEMKTARPEFYFRVLFDEPFGGTEVEGIGAELEGFVWDGYRLRDTLDHAVFAAELEAFHRRFADGCARGEMTRPAIADLLDRLGRLAA